MNRIKKISNILPLILVLLITFLFTFPDVSPDYGPGIDPSYVWALNWLFAHDYSTLIQLHYPFGPFAFLEIPTCEGNTFLFFLIFFTLMKCAFVILALMVAGVFNSPKNSLNEPANFNHWFVPSIFIFLASYFAGIGLLIIYNCLLLCLLYLQRQKWWALIAASLLASLALFIKISIGVNSLAIVASCLILLLVTKKQFKSFALQCLIFIALFLAVSLAVLHTPRNIFNWYNGALHLVFGYGSMSLLYPNNLWLLIFLLTLPAAFIACGSQTARQTCFPLIIPIFAFWKHGIIREDCTHYFGLVYFIIIFWLLITLLEEKRKTLLLVLGAISVLSLTMNAAQMDGFDRKNSRTICGIKNVSGPFFHYRKYIANAEEYSRWRLQDRQLPDTFMQIIGNSSIDIYPFEFSYAAQNPLHWQPRASLSTAFSPWLEAQSVKNFSDKNHAVQYILWHFQDDIHGKQSVSMDNRYFLNDEPEIVKYILNHYEKAMEGDHLLLLSRRATPALEQTVYDTPFQCRWNEWVDIPQTEESIVRVKVHSHKSLRGKIRSLLYRDEIYTIEYQTEGGECYTYRYDPATATEGLWCNPFVQQPCDTTPEAPALRFRLSISDASCVKPEIDLQFEYLTLKKD